jgi:hypothetical protein
MRWYKSILWNPLEDEELVFRDMKTNEVFTFYRKGIWNAEGINHKLLN